MTNYLITAAITLLIATGVAAAGSPPAGARHFAQTGGAGTLEFTFVQAGADTTGRFREFATKLTYDASNPAAGALEVTVQIGSIDTQDKDRDDTLLSADLLHGERYPTARYLADKFVKRGDGLEALGKLTLHGVTRDLALPLSVRATAGGVEISGEALIRRLDYGIGQGDWKSTEWVGDEVKIRFRVPLGKVN